MPPPSKRYVWLDVAKGIGIILVVYGHVLRGLSDAQLLNDFQPQFLWSDYLLYLFHMPLFFCLSGLTVEASLRKGRAVFLLDKLLTIVYPYVLWSIIQVSIQIVASRATNHPTTANALLEIWRDPPSPFWFLYSLMICHIIVAMLPEPGRKATLLILSVALVTGMFIAISLQVLELDVDSLFLKTIYNFLFYAIAVAAAKFVLASSVRALEPLAAAGLFLGAAWGNYIAYGFTTVTPLAIPAALAGIWFVIAAAKVLDLPSNHPLAALGRASLSIYVMHIIAGSGMRIVLVKAGLVNPAAHLLLGVAAGVGLPWLAHGILQKFGLLPLFGLSRARPATAGQKIQ